MDVWITADGQLAVIHGGNGGHIGHVHHQTDHKRFEQENYPLIFETTLPEARKLFSQLPEQKEAKEWQAKLVSEGVTFGNGDAGVLDFKQFG